MAEGVYPRARAAAVIDPSEARLAIACKPEMLTVTSLLPSWDSNVINGPLVSLVRQPSWVVSRIAPSRPWGC
jgi:hypothetical protein